MKAYKGFNKDMTCRGFQFEEGKTYQEDTANLCESGFHACENPLDCFRYYAPTNSVYHEVELDEVDKTRSEDDSKRCGKIIKIGANLDIIGIVKATFDFVYKKSKEPAAGDWSNAAATGYRSNAAAAGNGSNAAAAGEESNAAANNKNSVAIATGKNAKARGVKGAYIVLTEWNDDATEILSAKMAQVDGEKIKADTWYKLENGEFVEVLDENE